MSEPEDTADLGEVELTIPTSELGISAEMREHVEDIQRALQVVGSDLVAAKMEMTRRPDLPAQTSLDIDLALEGLDKVGKGLVLAWEILDDVDEEDVDEEEEEEGEVPT
jgi:hypothetical protein